LLWPDLKKFQLQTGIIDVMESSLLKFLLPGPRPTNCPSKYSHALPKRKDSTIKEAPMMLILTIFLLATVRTVFGEEIALEVGCIICRFY
jgi:hypothetical protein